MCLLQAKQVTKLDLNHIASPDVAIDEELKVFVMYFHAGINKNGQK